ncbi:MAG: amidohydrolase family protein [Candidatus Heimdallarchaeota archaeon]|nr:amidohydrolase family protein [Candidatus Heimdallarchaeota archaeon]
MDIAIINSILITFENQNLGIIESGGIGITEDKISYVGPMKGFDFSQADIVIDGRGMITMPGLINVHFHSGHTLLRGGAQDLPEIEWMNKGIGPFSKHIKDGDRILGSKLGLLEGIHTGTTTFAEFSTDVKKLVEEVYLPLGVRVVATETINEVSSKRSKLEPTDLYEFNKSKGEKGIKKANAVFKEFETSDLVSCMYGPQALDMISVDLLSTIKELAEERQSQIHMHVAQGERERIQIKGRYGNEASTVSVLKEINYLNENFIAAHIHDTTVQERKMMVKQEVKLASCQSSIAMIDGIVPPLYHYRSIGGTAGLGTDQAPGPGNHNMFREMRSASVFGKIQNKDPTVLPAWEVLTMATIGGAKVLGLEDSIGSLKVGKQADIITIDLQRLNMTPWVSKPFHNFIPNLVYSSNGTEVSNVIINGNIIYKNNEFASFDLFKLIDSANRHARRIFGDSEKDWRKAGSKMVEKVDQGWL